MKHFVMILLVLIGFAGLIIPQSFASNQEQSDSKTGYEFVLDDCINPGDFAVGHVFENATHYMDNTYCVLFEKHILKGPDNEIAEKRILDNLPNFIKSPLKQSKIGISFADIMCNDDYVKVQKFDGSTACVKSETAPKLIERGWANGAQIENKWTVSYYPNKISLPNGKFDENIEKVLLWNLMKELERHDIKNWRNDPDTGAHTDEGWMNPSKMCSKIFLEDKTKYYASAKFYSEPELNITEIVIDNLRPAECQKWFWIPYEIKFENGNMVYEYEQRVETAIGN